MIINNITDCTIEMYDKATRGQLDILNQTGKEQPPELIYDAYLNITDEFNHRIENSRYNFEMETKKNNQHYVLRIERIKLGVRILDLLVENPAFGAEKLTEIAKKSITGGGIKWLPGNFEKMLKKAKAKISYYENQIEVNSEKLKSLKSDESKGSIYSLVSLLRTEGVTVNSNDSLIILADCLNNLKKQEKK